MKSSWISKNFIWFWKWFKAWITKAPNHALGHLALIQQDILQIRAVYHPSVGQVEKICAFLAKATGQDFFQDRLSSTSFLNQVLQWEWNEPICWRFRIHEVGRVQNVRHAEIASDPGRCFWAFFCRVEVDNLKKHNIESSRENGEQNVQNSWDNHPKKLFWSNSHLFHTTAEDRNRRRAVGGTLPFAPDTTAGNRETNVQKTSWENPSSKDPFRRWKPFGPLKEQKTNIWSLSQDLHWLWLKTPKLSGEQQLKSLNILPHFSAWREEVKFHEISRIRARPDWKHVVMKGFQEFNCDQLYTKLFLLLVLCYKTQGDPMVWIQATLQHTLLNVYAFQKGPPLNNDKDDSSKKKYTRKLKQHGIPVNRRTIPYSTQ